MTHRRETPINTRPFFFTVKPELKSVLEGFLTGLRVLQHGRQAAPDEAGPLRLHALHLSQRGREDGLDGLQGRRHGHGHRTVHSLHRSFPQHPRDQEEHRGQDGHAACRAEKNLGESFHDGH